MADDNVKMRESLVNFDMLICEKANKGSVYTLENKIYEEFIQKKDYNAFKDGLLAIDVTRKQDYEQFSKRVLDN